MSQMRDDAITTLELRNDLRQQLIARRRIGRRRSRIFR